MTSSPRAPPSLDHRPQGSTKGRQGPGGGDPRAHPRPPAHTAREEHVARGLPAGVPSLHLKGPPGTPQAGRTDTTSHGPERRRADPGFRGRHGPWPTPSRPVCALRRRQPRPPHPLRGVQMAPEDTPAWASHHAEERRGKPREPGGVGGMFPSLGVERNGEVEDMKL